MDRFSRTLIGIGAIGAPVLHTLTDLLEWRSGGFTPMQLWLNYIAFVPMPAMMVGLYAVQRPRAGATALAGALLYGFAFVYFAHTTLYAIATEAPTYAALWAQLGSIYTAHGALMIVGGALFGWTALSAAVLPRTAALAFLFGIALNLMVALLPVPEAMQIAGTTLRNAGLAAMGWSVLRARHSLGA